MHVILVANLVAVLVVLAGAVSAESAEPATGSSQYVVRPDPRLCPSPRCGGYWASLANRARTTCHDGALRPRCYVAAATGQHGQPLAAGIPADGLARASIESRPFDGLGELGVLVVADIHARIGSDRAGVLYRVRDLGVRCVRAPCFSLSAGRVNGSSRATLSELDLGTASLTAAQTRRAEAAVMTPDGLFASGRIVRTADGGRLLRAWRVYLRSATTRG